jgi:hypothetical protein
LMGRTRYLQACSPPTAKGRVMYYQIERNCCPR